MTFINSCKIFVNSSLYKKQKACYDCSLCLKDELSKPRDENQSNVLADEGSSERNSDSFPPLGGVVDAWCSRLSIALRFERQAFFHHPLPARSIIARILKIYRRRNCVPGCIATDTDFELQNESFSNLEICRDQDGALLCTGFPDDYGRSSAIFATTNIVRLKPDEVRTVGLKFIASYAEAGLISGNSDVIDGPVGPRKAGVVRLPPSDSDPVMFGFIRQFNVDEAVENICIN